MNQIVALRTNRDYYDVREAAEYSLTVNELIDILSYYSGDTKVVFSNDNGYTYGVLSDNTVKNIRVRMNESLSDYHYTSDEWDDENNICYIFQLSKMVMFQVSYKRLRGNKLPYFSTVTQVFCKNKRDISCTGSNNLKNFPLAYEFYQKWDGEHLHRLDVEKYDELLRDIEELKQEYNWEFTKSGDGFPFHREVELSKQKPKRRITPRR